MAAVFLKLLNMGIAAGWMILAVIVLRLLLRKAPKWSICLLWGLVAFRLICPFSLESVYSMIPSRETVRPEAVASAVPVIDSGVEIVDNIVNPVIRQSMPPQTVEKVNPMQVWLLRAGIVWAVIAGLMILYGLAGYVRLRLRVRTAVRLKEPAYQSEFVDTPFILGLFRPRIYLPSDMPEELRIPVMAHEQAHLKRRDHFWKIFGYGLLSVYWFHPLCWVAYILFCRDIELACDEKVVRNYDPRQRKAYSEALLACSSTGRHVAVTCPLAFGEVGVRERIRSVLNYKKPAFWLIAAAIAACAAAAVCFLTDPVKEGERFTEADRAETDESGSREMAEEPEEGLRRDENSGAESASQDSGELSEAEREEAFLKRWTGAFVNRDGDAIAAMSSGEAIADLKERELLLGSEGHYSFGMSSPWPVDEEADVIVYSSYGTMADIYYYAWTSEPHVTVWMERLFYENRDGEYVVTGERLDWYDDISTAAQYQTAYQNGMITGSRMDYQANGAGEMLQDNAMLDSSMRYGNLFEPESAAVELLNLSEDSKTVGVERIWDSGDTVGLEISFLQEGYSFLINMTRQGGAGGGVWVPGDYYVDPIFRLKQVDWSAVKQADLSVGSISQFLGVICLARIPEKQIVLYGYDDENCCQGVAVEIGTERYYFDWVYTSPRGALAECWWDEANRRLQVTLSTYTGTGLDAQELHVLEYRDKTLTDNVLNLDDFADLLYERIQYAYEENVPHITLLDGRDQTELATVEVLDEPVRELELGNISHFILGKRLLLQVDTGYYVGESYGVAEYDNMPVLEAEILMQEDGQGGIRFELGDIIALQRLTQGGLTPLS